MARVAAIRAFAWRNAMVATRSPALGCSMRGKLLRALGIALPESGKVSSGTFIGSRNVRFGEHFSANVDCHLDGTAPLTMGEHVTLGPRVVIITGTHPIGPPDRRRQWGMNLRPVHIGDGAWLHANAIVIGVDIAPGCMIGAGAVVTRPTLPNGFYTGNPARRTHDIAPDGTLTKVTTS